MIIYQSTGNGNLWQPFFRTPLVIPLPNHLTTEAHLHASSRTCPTANLSKWLSCRISGRDTETFVPCRDRAEVQERISLLQQICKTRTQPRGIGSVMHLISVPLLNPSGVRPPMYEPTMPRKLQSEDQLGKMEVYFEVVTRKQEG
jgi:hypothetical protein